MISGHSALLYRKTVHLDGLVSVENDGGEERQDGIDEQSDERVEIDAGVPPEQRWLRGQGTKRGKHVVAIDEGEQAFRCRCQRFKLKYARKLSDVNRSRKLWLIGWKNSLNIVPSGGTGRARPTRTTRTRRRWVRHRKGSEGCSAWTSSTSRWGSTN